MSRQAALHADGERPATSRHSGWRGITSRPWWPWAKRIATLAFFALIAMLVISEARAVDWNEVFASMRRAPPLMLLAAAALAATSHALYSTFDLIGRRYTHHKLPARSVVAVNFISYAFNLNLGALVGGIAFRYRLYTRLGLKLGVITRVVSLSMLTNWLGYVLLAGVALCWQPIALPPDWRLGSLALQGIGALMIAAAIGYVVFCGVSRRRAWKLRGHRVVLPSLRMALLQLAISCTNWLVIASVVYMLLQQRVPFPAVVCGLLAAAVAGVITHVPAGLGVLEAVFVALLSHLMPKEQLLASLLIYRALYYLVPLLGASLLYVVLEARAKKAARSG